MCSHKCLSLFCTYDSAADAIGAPTLCVVSYKGKRMFQKEEEEDDEGNNRCIETIAIIWKERKKEKK